MRLAGRNWSSCARPGRRGATKAAGQILWPAGSRRPGRPAERAEYLPTRYATDHRFSAADGGHTDGTTQLLGSRIVVLQLHSIEWKYTRRGKRLEFDKLFERERQPSRELEPLAADGERISGRRLFNRRLDRKRVVQPSGRQPNRQLGTPSTGIPRPVCLFAAVAVRIWSRYRTI